MQSPPAIAKARALAIFGDSLTTDHISPAGAISAASPAGIYLSQQGISQADFNTYGARRGNHEVMVRGTFANPRLRNLLAGGVSGGHTRHQPSGEPMTIFAASERYQQEGTPLLIFAGHEYGTGSSRDWAAKGTALLGVRAVVAQSFERIHRSNLIGMGVLPCQFEVGTSAASLQLDGSEEFGLILPPEPLTPKAMVTLGIQRKNGDFSQVTLCARIDTPIEAQYYRHGGILPFTLRSLI